MRTTVKRPAGSVTYQPTPSEPVRPMTRAEELFRARSGRRSLSAAHIAMERGRSDFLLSLRCLIETESWERVTTWTQPVDELLAMRPVLPLSDALARKANRDGNEDGPLTQLAGEPSNELLARSVMRLLLAERTATDDLIAAMCAQFGWRA